MIQEQTIRHDNIRFYTSNPYILLIFEAQAIYGWLLDCNEVDRHDTVQIRLVCCSLKVQLSPQCRL